jgi:hypothetical protein
MAAAVREAARILDTRVLLARRGYVTRRHPCVTFEAAGGDGTNLTPRYRAFDSSRLQVPPDRRLEAFSRAHDDSGLPGEHDLAPLLDSTGAADDRPHPPPDSAESLV